MSDTLATAGIAVTAILLGGTAYNWHARGALWRRWVLAVGAAAGLS